ncbi:MAG: nucleoside deaminase [Bullifex sp.]
MHVIEDRISERDKELLRECVKVAHEAMESGNHPFGALLADKDGNILMTQKNAFTEGGSAYHAETLLSLKAAKQYSPEFLKECTLYTNFEPCVMCTGALYWSGIGRLVYGVTEEMLLSLTGDNDENPTFSLSSRTVIEAGQKEIKVAGPTDDMTLIDEIVKDHIDFWK